MLLSGKWQNPWKEYFSLKAWEIYLESLQPLVRASNTSSLLCWETKSEVDHWLPVIGVDILGVYLPSTPALLLSWPAYSEPPGRGEADEQWSSPESQKKELSRTAARQHCRSSMWTYISVFTKPSPSLADLFFLSTKMGWHDIAFSFKRWFQNITP